MSRRLSTIRMVPKSGDIEEIVRTLIFELYYELYPENFQKSRTGCFLKGYYDTEGVGLIRETELRLYHRGLKFRFWLISVNSIRTSRELSYQRLGELGESFEFLEFAIEEGSGTGEIVPLLYDNVRSTLNALGIDVLKEDDVPESVRKKKCYKNKGGYETARLGLLHPKLRDRLIAGESLEDIIREFIEGLYRKLNYELPQTENPLDLLVDYSKKVREIYERRSGG